jgi:hypothetical protein
MTTTRGMAHAALVHLASLDAGVGCNVACARHLIISIMGSLRAVRFAAFVRFALSGAP